MLHVFVGGRDMNRGLKIIFLSMIISVMLAVPVMAEGEHEHTWTDWSIDSVATCDESGSMSRYCTECNQYEYKSTPATGKHTWRLSDTSYNDYSKTQHKVTSYYECSQCYESKSDSKLQNHSWNYGEKYSFTKKSASQHTYQQMLECKNCYHWHDRTVTESHHFNKYGECNECDYVKAKNTTLKAGKNAYVNEKSWIKIKVKKKGYLVVNVREGKGSKHGYGSQGWGFYNSNKKVFLDHNYNYGKGCVPVNKGTYYIRTSGKASVKYTFKKDPSKKNYTQGKAQKLKRKKAVTGVIYPSASKKSWIRYYKVSLTKKQFLRYSFTKNISNVTSYITSIRDSKGNWYSTEPIRNSNGDSTNKWTSSEKLKKGTYYIVVEEGYTSASRKRNAGTVFTLKWY